MSLLTKPKKNDAASVAGSGAAPKEKKPFLPTTRKPKDAAGFSQGTIDYSALPQVNLLPLEIIEKRNLKSLQVKIGLYFLLLIAVLALAFGAVTFEKNLAQKRYDKAVEETARLKAEERKYAEVPLVLTQIDKSKTALRDGMYREILWDEYIGAIAATVPDDGIIKEISVTAASPNTAGPQEADLLQDGSIGQLSFVANLKTFPDSSAWAEELESIPGLQDARFESAQYSKPGGDITYEYTGTVRISEDAYSGRFEPKEEEVEK